MLKLKSLSEVFVKSNLPYFRFYVKPDGYFQVDYSEPSGWTHVAMNYLGPNDSEGIKIYYNGKEAASDTTKSNSSRPDGEGRIVLGRFYTHKDERYSCVQVDELLFFNNALSSTDIIDLNNSVHFP